MATHIAAKRRAFLFTNHAPDAPIIGYDCLDGDIIAVDKGLKKVHELKLKAHIIIGDFDSLKQDELKNYPLESIIRYQAEKNETDTELALLWCLKQKAYDEIFIFNDLGGRIDHSLALIQNLMMMHKAKLPTFLVSQSQILFFLNDFTPLKGTKGDILSLIPYSSFASFQSSTGLAYPLASLTLYKDKSRGISNVFTTDEPTIALQEGLVLAVHTPSQPLRLT